MRLNNTHAVILAAGRGKRLGSSTPKPLQKMGGVRIVNRIVKAVGVIDSSPVLVVGRDGHDIAAAAGVECRYVNQDAPRGTGDALRSAERELRAQKPETILIMPSDHPFIDAATLHALISTHLKANAVLTISTLRVPRFDDVYRSFRASGRIVRDARGAILGIIEAKEAGFSDSMHEVNTSYYAVDATWLWKGLQELRPAHASGEYYITDLVAAASRAKQRITSFDIKNPVLGLGVNTRDELNTALRVFQTSGVR